METLIILATVLITVSVTGFVFGLLAIAFHKDKK